MPSMGRLMSDIGTSLRVFPRSFWYLLGGQLTNRLAGFVTPFMTIYLAADRHDSAEFIGSAVALFGAGCLIAGLVGGVLADRIGRRPVIFWSELLAGGWTVAFALTSDRVLIAASLFAIGLFATMPRPAMAAVIVDIVPEADVMRAYSLSHWANNVGMVIAPLLVIGLAAHGIRPLFLADAATTVVFGAMMYFTLPESKPADAADAGGAGQQRTGYAQVLRDGRFMLFTVVALAIITLLTQYYITLPLAMHAAGLSKSAYAVTLLVNTVMVTTLQVPLGQLTKSVDPWLVLMAGALFVAAGFGANLWVSAAFGYAATTAVWTIGEMLCVPAMAAVTAYLSPVHARGRYQGVNSLAWTLAAIIAPAAGAATFAAGGSRPVWLGSLVIGVACVAGLVLLRPGVTPKVADASQETIIEEGVGQ